ncbi:MAG: hypothetical protein IEMM0008_1736 [bacterium]|nr:MAG: hypothetical protein IEMM0008_1736 [bacterium]
MVSINCRKCSSPRIKKNGHTKSGQQKYHCHHCGFYGTLFTRDKEKKLKYKLIEKLHLERVSQRGISRTLRVSRKTIANILKKNALSQ